LGEENERFSSMSFLDRFLNFGSNMAMDMAIDLGTANTLVAVTGEGIVINEPSVVAIEKSTQSVLAVGHEAKNMINHTPDAFSAEHPLKDGVIADYDVTEAMLSAFINKASDRKYPWQPKPRIVICIPCGATSVEKRAVFEAAIQAGARQAYLIEEPMAAAMGADLPVTEPTGSMVVDIGGGTTEVAVISLGGIVSSSSLRLAGNRLDEAIALHLRDLLGIKIGERTAEIIKIKIGSILPFEDGRERDMIISGQDVYTEQPKEVTIQSEDVRAALQAPIEEMVVHIKDTFKTTNPDLASDIIQNGILLTGGGGLLSGLDRYLTDRLEIPVWVSETALTNVVSGCLKVLETPTALRQTLMRSK
jgi:rod shape-determining protein MreB